MWREGRGHNAVSVMTHTTHEEEISGGEKFARALKDAFGASQGLNADWSFDAWPIGRGLWILDNEDGTFALVKRTTVGDEFVIEELGRIQP